MHQSSERVPWYIVVFHGWLSLFMIAGTLALPCVCWGLGRVVLAAITLPMMAILAWYQARGTTALLGFRRPPDFAVPTLRGRRVGALIVGTMMTLMSAQMAFMPMPLAIRVGAALAVIGPLALLYWACVEILAALQAWWAPPPPIPTPWGSARLHR
jgi:hypothetical protein